MIEFPLPPLSVLDVCGADAATILNNLTTNDVRSLPEPVRGADAKGRCFGLETFITDVRGRCIGHVIAYRLQDRYRLIGAAGQSDGIANHVDRYTIREDVSVVQHGRQYLAKLMAPLEKKEIGDTSAEKELPPHALKGFVEGTDQFRVEVPWLSQLPEQERADEDSRWWLDLRIGVEAAAPGRIAMDPSDSFHHARIAAGFPWHGVDFDDANLPQELDRDAFAISFHKGCYLGQETVARLDALGKVQKKLVSWELQHALLPPDIPRPDHRLYASPEDAQRAEEGEKVKPVGRLTSVVALSADDGVSAKDASVSHLALGMARRSHFEAGATAYGVLPSGGDFSGVVR